MATCGLLTAAQPRSIGDFPEFVSQIAPDLAFHIRRGSRSQAAPRSPSRLTEVTVPSWRTLLPLPLLIYCGITAIFIWANVSVANRKSLNPWSWVLAAGPLGLVVLYFLPSASKSRLTDDQVRRRVVVGNVVGLVMSGISVVSYLSLLIPDSESLPLRPQIEETGQIAP